MESIESTAYHGFPWIPRNFHGFGWNSMDSVKLNGLGNPRIPWSFTASSVFLECYLIHRIRRNRDSARAMDSTRAFGILEIMAMWKSEDSMDPSNHMEFRETHRNMGIPRNSWNFMEFQPIGITECWKSVNSTKTSGFHSLLDSTEFHDIHWFQGDPWNP